MSESHEIKVLDDVEHVLLRPNMYIGSITIEKKIFWVPHENSIIQDEIDYIPGLYKIFCEILDNCIDEHKRGFCKNITVEYNKKENYFSVSDDGRGISPEKHETGKYTPEVVFSVLRSGSNFDDSKREGIGMNGVGCSLTNIFSEKFYVEITRNGKKYKQTFKQNNQIIEKPIIKPYSGSSTGTSVTFWPDTSIFKLCLDERLVYKRCMELSYMFPSLKIHLKINENKKTFNGKDFEEFCKKFNPTCESIENKEIYRLGFFNNFSGDGLCQFSLVNGAETWRSGTHIDVCKEIICDKIVEMYKKKYKEDITNQDIVKFLGIILFINVKSPMFDGQTKEKLSMPKNTIQSLFTDISSKKLNSIINNIGILESIFVSMHEKNEQKEMLEIKKLNKKAQGAKIAKLIDCSSKKRMDCILYITEGDSAVAGLSSIRNPSIHAGLPLRGKILNVNGLSATEVMKNAEIITLMGAIGLEIGKSPIKIERGNVVPTTLRYGNISILTDADHDGSAIRCLLINFFYRFWPELFLHKIISISEAPLYGVEYKGRQSFFYTVSEYEKYIKSHDGCRISYYKGLGSCSTKAWDYFINSNPNMYNVIVNEKTKETLEMVFGEDSDKRKEWLRKV